MRAISKGREPLSLTEHRSTPGSDYNGYQDKETLRNYLVREQKGLCCYCMQRVRPDRTGMKIEHWHSQSAHPFEDLDYLNLLACCMGRSDNEERCDTFKADRELSRNPSDPQTRISDLIRFKPDGIVYSTDPLLNQELDVILNLNIAILARSRKDVLLGFVAGLRLRQKRNPAFQPNWRKLLEEWEGTDSTESLKPFCQIVVDWIYRHHNR